MYVPIENVGYQPTPPVLPYNKCPGGWAVFNPIGARPRFWTNEMQPCYLLTVARSFRTVGDLIHY